MTMLDTTAASLGANAPAQSCSYADAILDRLVHNAHRIELAGESLRRVRPSREKLQMKA